MSNVDFNFQVDIILADQIDKLRALDFHLTISLNSIERFQKFDYFEISNSFDVPHGKCSSCGARLNAYMMGVSHENQYRIGAL